MIANALKSIAVFILCQQIIISAAAGQEQIASDTAPPKIYMLNMLWFGNDAETELYVEYLMTVQSFMGEYGGNPLGAYMPSESRFGSLKPDLYGIVEWPSKAKMEAFFRDPRYRAVEHLRDKGLKRFELVESMSQDDAPIPIDPEIFSRVKNRLATKAHR